MSIDSDLRIRSAAVTDAAHPQGAWRCAACGLVPRGGPWPENIATPAPETPGQPPRHSQARGAAQRKPPAMPPKRDSRGRRIRSASCRIGQRRSGPLRTKQARAAADQSTETAASRPSRRLSAVAAMAKLVEHANDQAAICWCCWVLLGAAGEDRVCVQV